MARLSGWLWSRRVRSRFAMSAGARHARTDISDGSPGMAGPAAGHGHHGSGEGPARRTAARARFAAALAAACILFLGGPGPAQAQTAPALQSATTSAMELKLSYDTNLDATSVPAASAFAVTVGGASRSLSSTNPVRIGSGGDVNKVYLTLSSAALAGETVTVSYTAPTTNKIQSDTGSIAAASFSNQAVVNWNVPSAPTSFTATPGGGEVTLSWAAPTHAGTLTKYQYRYSDDGESTWQSWTDVGGGATALSVTVTGLTNGTEHTFELRAVNMVSGRGPSEEMGGTAAKLNVTPQAVTVPLTSLAVTDGVNSVTLSPAFNANRVNYTASVGAGVTRLTLTTTAGAGVTTSFLDASDAAIPDADGDLDGHQVDVAEGENVIKVQTTDGTDTSTYRLTVTRAASRTGTIENSEAILQTWISRFGRTVSDQVLAAAQERLRAARSPGAEIGLGGQRIGLGPVFGEESGATDEGSAAGGSRTGTAAVADAEEQARLKTLTAWMNGEDPEKDAWANRTRSTNGREALLGSSFSLAAQTDGGGFTALWGRIAQSRFSGREETLSVDGDVTTGLLGADYAWDRWTTGLVVSRSTGTGGYRGESSGGMEASVTAVTPWAGYAASERLSVWGAAGYGAGELTVKPDKQATMRTDLDMMLAAAGARGRVAGEKDGPLLDAVTGARWVRTTSARLSSSDGNLAAAAADVRRLTLGLEGSWPLALGGETAGKGATATPRFGLGLRHDGGDAETGYGVDIAGGIDLAVPGEGLRASLSGRGVLTHEAAGLTDRGIAGTLAWKPGSSGRGPSLSLSQTFGAGASGGKDALLARESLEGLAANDNDNDGDVFGQRRLEARFGYGLGTFGGRFTGTPEVALGLSEGGRDYGLGWRMVREGSGPGWLEFSLKATRRESANDAPPGHGVGFRLMSRW